MAEIETIRAFSKASSSYDQHAHIQRECACELISRLDDIQPARVLDIGCGTGLLTRMLAVRFPSAKITACDPSRNMIHEARRIVGADNVEFICRGVENLQDGQWDLIASNAALHWTGDIGQTLDILKGRLVTGGVLAFSYFTSSTYPELSQTLTHAAGFEVRLPSHGFATADELQCEFASRFEAVSLDIRTHIANFADLRAMLEHIKLTGTRGGGSQPQLRWSRQFLERAQDEYIAHFGAIRATYEVMICTARQSL